MKSFIAVLIFFSSCAVGVSQPPTTYSPNRDTAKIIDIRERLVQLAMQNPNYEVADRTVNKNYYELQKSKTSWLDIFSAQTNVNSITINSQNPIATLYPKWNVGVSVPFDYFFVRKNNIKIAKENYLISEAQRNEMYRRVKAEVLTAYENYLMYKQLLDLQIRVTQDDYTLYIAKEKDYQDGIILQEDYNKAYRAWADQQTRRLEAQKNYNVSKINLEQLIGVPIEQVIGTNK
ncbi:MAG TPA: TolC family protein [Chitinophagaceae bacterium]|nr:TolC family protein [Chitinophagaceae bacterium]